MMFGTGHLNGKEFNVLTNIRVPILNPNNCDEVVWTTCDGMEKDFAVKSVCRDLRSNVPKRQVVPKRKCNGST